MYFLYQAALTLYWRLKQSWYDNSRRTCSIKKTSESQSRGQLPSVKRFLSPEFEPDHPETPGIKEKTRISLN